MKKIKNCVLWTGLLIMSVSTIITWYHYPENLFIYLSMLALILGMAIYAFCVITPEKKITNKQRRYCLIGAIIIFFCGSFVIIKNNAEPYTLIIYDNNVPKIVNSFMFRVPHTYRLEKFDQNRKLFVKDEAGNKLGKIIFRLSDKEDTLLNIARKFKNQKSFDKEVQNLVNPQFFNMNDIQKKEYLKKFTKYGLNVKSYERFFPY